MKKTYTGLKFAAGLPGALFAFLLYSLAVSWRHYVRRLPVKSYSVALEITLYKSMPYFSALIWAAVLLLTAIRIF